MSKKFLLSCQNEIEVLKSRFIAIGINVNSVDEFKNYLTNLRKEHKKAKHIVYAYKIANLTKSNDDGEPKGVAGRPILEVLLKKDMNNIAVFVVRYFGGSKLGASRLLRTYVTAASGLLDETNLVEDSL